MSKIVDVKEYHSINTKFVSEIKLLFRTDGSQGDYYELILSHNNGEKTKLYFKEKEKATDMYDEVRKGMGGK